VVQLIENASVEQL